MADATTAYRAQILELRSRTYRDLLAIWPAFRPEDSTAVAAWMSGAAAIARRDRALAAGLTQQYLRSDAAQSGVRLEPRNPAPLPAEQLDTSLRVTSLVAYAVARRAGKQPGQALQIASVRSSGAVARLVLNGGRSVVAETAKSGQIAGWYRVGNPQCDLCKTILGRFYPAKTQAFQCHDHCSCTFSPAYR